MSRPCGVASMRAATRRWHFHDLAPKLTSVWRRTAFACASACRSRAVSTGGSARRIATRRACALGTPHPHVVGNRLHHLVEHGVAGQTEDIVQAVGLAPCHHLAAAVVAVATDRDARVGPMAADPPHHAPQMAADLLAARCLARTEHNHNRTCVCCVVDVDWQEATLVIM